MRSGRCHAVCSPTLAADAVLLEEWPSPQAFLNASQPDARAHWDAAVEEAELVQAELVPELVLVTYSFVKGI